MSRILVLDGADLCRAPIVEFALAKQFTGDTWLGPVQVGSRGLTATTDRTICEVAALRLGLREDAAAFAERHRAAQVVRADIDAADLVLTAERAHRAAVVRLVPDARAKTFTWKESLVLASAAVDRVRAGAGNRPGDLTALARELHAARDVVPLIEPAVATAAFHWQPEGRAADPLAVADGHDAADDQHRHTVDESYSVAAQLGNHLVALVDARTHAAMTGHPAGRRRAPQWDIST